MERYQLYRGEHGIRKHQDQGPGLQSGPSQQVPFLPLEVFFISRRSYLSCGSYCGVPRKHPWCPACLLGRPAHPLPSPSPFHLPPPCISLIFGRGTNLGLTGTSPRLGQGLLLLGNHYQPRISNRLDRHSRCEKHGRLPPFPSRGQSWLGRGAVCERLTKTCWS